MFYKKLFKQLGLTLSITALVISPIYGTQTDLNALSTEKVTSVFSPFTRNYIDYEIAYCPWDEPRVSVNSTTDGQVVEILCNGQPLKLGQDYNYRSGQNTGTISFSNQFLDNQSIGKLTLEVVFESAKSYNLYFNILPSNTTASLSSLEATYDPSNTNPDVNTIVEFHHDSLSSITMNGKELVYDDDYSVTRTMTDMGVWFTESFLKTLPEGKNKIEFNFKNTGTITFIINVLPPKLSPNGKILPLTDTYELSSSSKPDPITVVFNADSVSSTITMDGAKLVEGKDYTVERNVYEVAWITFTDEFLNSLSIGKHEIVFTFHNAGPITYTLNVTDSNFSPFKDKYVKFDLNNANNQDYIINLDTEKTGALTTLFANDKALVKDVDYTVYPTYIRFTNNFLMQFQDSKLEPIEVPLKAEFESGATYNLPLSILPGKISGEIKPLSGTYDPSNNIKPSPISVIFNRDGVSSTITMNKLPLVEGQDYTAERRVYEVAWITFTDEFLNSLPSGKYEIVFNFEYAGPQVYTLNIVEKSQKTCSLKIASENGTPVNSNMINNNFNLSVSGDDTYDLSKLKVRYYYTADDAQAQNASMDNASLSYTEAPWYKSISDIVKAKIIPMENPTELADTYLELSFIGDEVLDQTSKLALNTRINKLDWSNYDQSNDYSYADSDNICVYYDGQLILGIEPK